MNFNTRVNGFGESQLINTIVQQDRVFFITIYKQSGGHTHNKIAMRYLLLKHCVRKISGFDMGIKMIAAEIGKAVNILRSNEPPECNQLIADLQLFKIFLKRMLTRIFSCGIRLIHIGNFGNSSRRTLYSYPLHIMFY